MSNQAPYIPRDLSWLSFNYRVLLEATDKSVPLFERIKFLAIYSSNLDEFFRVRIASLRQVDALDKPDIKKALYHMPQEVLDSIYEEVNNQQDEYGRIFREEILPELFDNDIHLYQNENIRPEHRAFVVRYFRSKVLSYLQPTILSQGKKAPFLENRAIYLAVKLQKPGSNHVTYAHLNIPSGELPRFISIPQPGHTQYLIMLDDIIRYNLTAIFPGYIILGCYSIKLNRDADLAIEDEFSGDLVNKIRTQLDQREIGPPSRFLYDSEIDPDLLDFLVEKFKLNEKDLVSGGRYHNLYDLFSIPEPKKESLTYHPLAALHKPALENIVSLFDAIDSEDRMLHFPYQSYDYVLRFFNEAAIDPAVTHIKVTLYRIAHNSFIANALISAARNGKKVTVFVEVKARFDEENNLRWAEKMEKAGVRLIYSIPGLKVHAKVALVRRRDEEGNKKHYAFFGTGNFNENTANIYADHGLMTSHAGMTDELNNVFKYLHKRKIPKEEFRHLLVSQFNLDTRFVKMIDKEIAAAKEGKPASIIIKLNNIEERHMIDKLYEASQVGVDIQLIVRGICCLRPGVKGLSENIRAIRIVDRFLEHARIFIFHNGGSEKMYLSSADWMRRNLHDRIEVGFPLYDPKLKAEIRKLIDLQLQDTCKGSLLDKHLVNHPIVGREDCQVRSQMDFYEWLRSQEDNTLPDLN
ncbi:polyphosphate kinase 1 [Roseivirga sp. BDSF3-8]|uniref:polyphosphate kinase 1 n=1 Tax=Roseivirga sp. BDSF3-8 TaxID=3241598 RepID=UPI003532473D